MIGVAVVAHFRTPPVQRCKLLSSPDRFGKRNESTTPRSSVSKDHRLSLSFYSKKLDTEELPSVTLKARASESFVYLS